MSGVPGPTVVPKAQFLAIMAGLTGLAPASTTWELDPEPFVMDGRVTLLVFGVVSVGVDEHRRHLSDGNDGYPAGTWWVEEIGNRIVTITVKTEIWDADAEAVEIIENIRTRIRAEAVRDQLDEISMAYINSTRAVRIPKVVDTRAVSAAAADFNFGAISRYVSLVIPPGVGGDYFTNVVFSGTETP